VVGCRGRKQDEVLLEVGNGSLGRRDQVFVTLGSGAGKEIDDFLQKERAVQRLGLCDCRAQWRGRKSCRRRIHKRHWVWLKLIERQKHHEKDAWRRVGRSDPAVGGMAGRRQQRCCTEREWILEVVCRRIGWEQNHWSMKA